jgi:hypothetical protein
MELWIYGIKNEENALLTAIQNVTANYVVMPSLIYGGLEYRVFVTDNSELLKLINNINKITGVMYSPERFAGLGVALNPDGTPWSEIGYMTDLETPGDVSLPMAGVWYDIIEWDYLSVTWGGGKFYPFPDGGTSNDMLLGVYSNEKPLEYHSANHIIANFVDDGDWYLFKSPTNGYIGVSKEKRSVYFKIVAARIGASGAGSKIRNQLYKWRKL